MVGFLKKITKRILTSEAIEAAKRGDAKAVDKFLGWGADVNFVDERDDTVLIWAIYKDDPVMVDAVMKYSPNIDFKNSDGNTALMSGAFYGTVSSMTELIKHKPNAKIKNAIGETALNIAVRAGFDNIARMLVHYDPSVCEIQGEFKRTPLMNAILRASDNNAEILLNYEQNLDICDKNGATALMYAIRAGKEDIAKLILAKNPNLNIKDNEGFDVFSLVKLKGMRGLERAISSMLAQNHSELKQGILGLSPQDIVTEKSGPLLKKIKNMRLLAEIFKGLDFKRQNALLIACWDYISKDDELNQKIQKIMIEPLENQDNDNSVSNFIVMQKQPDIQRG